MSVRGIRGAITVDDNSIAAISSAAKEMLADLLEKNNLDRSEIASIIFSATHDLDAAYPAVAAREIGFDNTPLFCTQEMKVQGALARCLRVLVHVNTTKSQTDMIHIYLKGAKVLRPDIARD